jgi:hypothetical protein
MVSNASSRMERMMTAPRIVAHTCITEKDVMWREW